MRFPFLVGVAGSAYLPRVLLVFSDFQRFPSFPYFTTFSSRVLPSDPFPLQHDSIRVGGVSEGVGMAPPPHLHSFLFFWWGTVFSRPITSSPLLSFCLRIPRGPLFFFIWLKSHSLGVPIDLFLPPNAPGEPPHYSLFFLLVLE